MRNKLFPNYPNDVDYTTNAPSYYDDLARKQKLIELLSKKIWEYEEKLNLTLEDIEERVAQRFDEWDLRIEKFPDNVEVLLQEWLSDGTLDHIINDTIFSWKADQVDLDATNAQLQQNVPFLNNGKLMLPSDFPKLPFDIYKNRYGNFYSDATPYNQFDWTEARVVYISRAGSGSGNSVSSPITLQAFKGNFLNGHYGEQKNFKLKITDYIYSLNNSASNNIEFDFDANILIEPYNASGFTWFGRVKNSLINNQTSDWSAYNNIYVTTQTNNHDVLDVVNLSTFSDFGMPDVYKKVSSLSECQSTTGTFFRDGADCYCNPFEHHNVEDLILIVSTSVVKFDVSSNNTIIFNKCGFLPSSYQSPVIDHLSARIYFFNCKWHRSTTNGMYVIGRYNVHLFDCVSSHSTLDTFNYHTDDENSLATEVNCVGFGAGKHKLTSGQPTHSNNGSTAHDGMYMLRVGSRYYDCEGPIVADVDNCYSISVGCEASGILESATGVKAAYYVYDRPTDTEATAKPKYIIECKGYGDNVVEGVRGTPKTYVANFIGNQNFAGDIKRSVEPW